ncbi:hypothetical protein ES703_45695 [subsurface metagenome]
MFQKGAVEQAITVLADIKAALGGLIDLIGNIALGDEAAKAKDILGRVYEYFLGEFAAAEGKKGGQFYTPKSIVRLMVEMIEPYRGRVYDPCCGSGGMFIMSEQFVESHQGNINNISIYGQESNQTTYRLCRMNLAIRQIDGSQVKWNNEGSFLNDAHKDLKADFILANPPFNDSDWSGQLLTKDPRWKYGIPPAGNANYTWLSHMIYHLSPKGIMACVLANGSLSSQTNNEGKIRKQLIENDLVDCIVGLPKQLFYNIGIPACVWFISRKRIGNGNRKRSGEILLIDASEIGFMRLVASLLIIACPVVFAIVSNIIWNEDGIETVFFKFYVPLPILIAIMTYSLCFASNVLVRKTARAWLIGMLMVCFLLVLPFMLPLNFKDYMSDVIFWSWGPYLAIMLDQQRPGIPL